MKHSREYMTFNRAMDAILCADPKAVKERMDAELQANGEERKAKGEHKRGRKPKSSSASGRAASAKDD